MAGSPRGRFSPELNSEDDHLCELLCDIGQAKFLGLLDGYRITHQGYEALGNWKKITKD